MPRGVKRSEVDLYLADIEEAEKKRVKLMKAASDEKQKITALEKKIEQAYARDIAKACRASGIKLEDVLKWVMAQQEEAITKEKAASDDNAAKAESAAVKKPASKRAAAKKPAARKPAAKRAAKPKTAAKPKPKTAVEKTPDEPSNPPSENETN